MSSPTPPNKAFKTSKYLEDELTSTKNKIVKIKMKRALPIIKA
jgi:hypothetical protein